MLTHKLTRNSFIGKLSKSTTCGLCATARPTLPQTTKVVRPNRTAAISATPAANRSAPAVGDQRPRPIRDPAEASGLQGGSYLLLHDRDDQAIALVGRERAERESDSRASCPHSSHRAKRSDLGARLRRKNPAQRLVRPRDQQKREPARSEGERETREKTRLPVPAQCPVLRWWPGRSQATRRLHRGKK